MPFSVPDTVIIRNTRWRTANRLNYDIGIYAQDSWTIKRLTINAGLRYEKLKAQVLSGTVRAGTVRARADLRGGREPAELERLGAAVRARCTTCSATPRRRSSTR